MRSTTRKTRFLTTRRELVLLLGASMACVLFLTMAVTGNLNPTSTPAFQSATNLLLLFSVGVSAIATILMVWRIVVGARRLKRKTDEELAELRSEYEALEAIIGAEPQVLLFWKREQDLKVVSHTLTGMDGLPRLESDIIQFGSWLDEASAKNLKDHLTRLFDSGRGFNIILKTKSATHIEADGRGAGARAVIRFRDVAGYRNDLAKILDQHKTLAQDIATSQGLLDALPMPAWLTNSDNKLTWVNQAYLSAVEAADIAEVLEDQIEILEQRQRKSMRDALRIGASFNQRLAINVAGTRKPHDVIALRMDHATAAVAIDVAELETAQGELDRQVEAFDRTLDQVTTAIAMFSADRKLVFRNEAFEKLWQLDTDWLDTHPGDAEVLDELSEQGRLPEVGSYREWRRKVLENNGDDDDNKNDYWHLPDGRVLHVISEQRLDGGITYLYVDETERFALKSRFNALSRVQGETLNSLNEGVAVFATDGRLKLYNTAFTKVWHLSVAMLDSQPHISEIVHQAKTLFEDEHTWNNLTRAIASFSDEREPLKGHMLRPDNSVINYATLPLPDGATLLTFTDVTEVKRYEKTLEERNDALVLSDRLKNQFIGHVSYELRTPLTNIIGFSDLLAAPHFGNLNDKQREFLNDITSSSKSLLAIIDDILDLATIDAGELELVIEPLNVRETIDAAIAGVADRAAREGLIIDIAIGDDAETFMGDKARIRQVLYNLLSNAVGFSHPEGVVLVTCWRDGNQTIFQVEDRGAGISKEDQAHIFDRFESRSKGSKHRGVGLGLSIVKSLVEQHGGNIILDSKEGFGTRVTVCLPEPETATIETDTYSDEEARALAAFDVVDAELEVEHTIEKVRTGTDD